MKWIKELSVAATLAAFGCGGEPGALPEREEPVEVAVSTSVASRSLTNVPGSVMATEEAQLATRISGIIRRVSVDIGSPVTRGDALVVLDTGEIDARIAGAEAAAELARRSYQRIAALAVDGAATEQELDDATARMEMANAALNDARAQREYVALRAPFSGIITARMADPGDLATPGVPILELTGTAGLKVMADVPAALSGRLSVGDAVNVVRPESGRRYAARVTRVVPAVEPSTRRFRIEALFASLAEEPNDLPPGTFVRVEFDEPTSTTRWIPADVIRQRGQLNGVFVVEGDTLRLRWVRLGQRLEGAVELLAGPPVGALLVRAPSLELADGRPVAKARQVEWAPEFVDERTASAEGVR